MRPPPNPKVERFRVRQGPLKSNSTLGNNGAFSIPHPSGVMLFCIVSDDKGWDHVSAQAIDMGVSRIPTWNEMQYLKELFFEDEETVIQYHVAKSKHLNLHPSVLHLWRPEEAEIVMPPSQMVAPRDAEELQRLLEGRSILE